MNIKQEQRKVYTKLRRELGEDEKVVYDRLIFEKVIKTKEFVDCESILIYVSMGFEVDTIRLIEYSLKLGKSVYAPLVTKEKRVMKFYRVNCLEALTENKMGILEPKAVDEWLGGKSLCIVPAIAFDVNGFRIGYGGGYYDYFLSLNQVDTIGIIYDEFVIEKVEIDGYDKFVSKVLTEKREIVINK